MRSVTSCFNKSIARSDLRHYWPILFGYTAIWVVVLPVMLWTMSSYTDEGNDATYYLSRHIFGTYSMIVVMALLFGGMLAMALFSYLMNSRSVGLMHAIPVRRSTLFWTHVLTGMGLLTCCNLLVAVLAVLAQLLRYGVVAWAAIGLWLVFSTVVCLLFFLLGVVCCMVTGWLLAVPVLYIISNFFVAGLTLLLQGLASFFYYGYTGMGNFPPITYWFTPAAKITGQLNNCQVASGRLENGPWHWWLVVPTQTLQTLAIYFFVALLLGALAWALYRWRSSEVAGDPLAYRWMRPIFRWGVGLLGGLALGMLLFILLFNPSSGGLKGIEVVPLLVCMLPTTVICYCGAEMLASKSLAVLRHCWKGALPLYLVVLLICGAMYMDLFGHERRVPEAAQVQEVRLSIYGESVISATCQEPETIEKILAFHSEILACQGMEEGDGPNYWVTLRYDLGDGNSLNRSYEIWKEGEMETALEDLLNTEEIRVDSVFGYTTATRGMELWGGYVNLAFAQDTVQLTASQAQQVLDAIFADLDAGSSIQVLGKYEEALYVNISFQTPGDEEIYVERIGPDWHNTIRTLLDLDVAQSEEDLLIQSQEQARLEAGGLLG